MNEKIEKRFYYLYIFFRYSKLSKSEKKIKYDKWKKLWDNKYKHIKLKIHYLIINNLGR